MQIKRIYLTLSLLLASLFGTAAIAQEASINVFSPYSMYGLGEINQPGSQAARSMGGAGVAQRTPAAVNLLNPAAYSVTMNRSVLFNFGLEAQNYYLSQPKSNGAMAKSSYNTVNFHDIALQLPLAKKLGMGFSLTPYSSVGYRLYGREVLPDVGLAEYDYEGEGDITQVKLGIGWEIFKNFSIGAAAQYYWGNIDRYFTMTIIPYTGDGSMSYPATKGTHIYSVSRFKGQFGFQYSPLYNRKNILTIAATYDLGGDLKPRVTNEITINGNFESDAKAEEGYLEVRLPGQVVAGIHYENNKVAISADYVYQNWGSRNQSTEPAAGGFPVAYCDTHTVKFGAEWTPNRNDVRLFLRRWHYRAGFNYGDYHQMFGGKRVPQYAVTLGIGIPVKFGGFSSIDVGMEYGCRGNHEIIAQNVGMIRQRYLKFSVAFSLFGEDYWFVRPKYD